MADILLVDAQSPADFKILYTWIMPAWLSRAARACDACKHFFPDWNEKWCTWVIALQCRISVICTSLMISKQRETGWQTRTPTMNHLHWQYCCVSMTTGHSMDQRGACFFSLALSNEANWIILSIYLCTQQSLPPIRVPFITRALSGRMGEAVGGRRLWLQLVCRLCAALRR